MGQTDSLIRRGTFPPFRSTLIHLFTERGGDIPTKPNTRPLRSAYTAKAKARKKTSEKEKSVQNPTAKKNHAAIYVVVVSRFARALVPRRSIRARRKAALHGSTIHPPKSHFAPFLPSFLPRKFASKRPFPSLLGWGPLGPHFVFSSLFSTRQASTASMYIVFPRPECFVHAHSFRSYSSLGSPYSCMAEIHGVRKD